MIPKEIQNPFTLDKLCDEIRDLEKFLMNPNPFKTNRAIIERLEMASGRIPNAIRAETEKANIIRFHGFQRDTAGFHIWIVLTADASKHLDTATDVAEIWTKLGFFRPEPGETRKPNTKFRLSHGHIIISQEGKIP